MQRGTIRHAHAAHWARWLAPALLLAGAVGLGGCASPSTQIAPRPDAVATYASWRCDRLFNEIDAVQQRAAVLAYAVDERSGNNVIALSLGVTVFWPALLAMRPDGEDAAQLAVLKGRFEALTRAAALRSCGTVDSGMPSDRQASFPVQVGDRLVYEERFGRAVPQRPPPRVLGLQVVALRRDHLEFVTDVDGQRQPGLWRQDLSGNPALEGRGDLLAWRRLLQPDLVLGQVVTGDMASAGSDRPDARLRGQVVAIGPQQVDGRRFDVAVIELFGDAPAAGATQDLTSGRTRLDGVMAVDRRSGVLLRLDLRSANPLFDLQRRLVRIEAPAP